MIQIMTCRRTKKQ